MFTALNAAITLQVGFRIFGKDLNDNSAGRHKFWLNEVCELRTNSGFTTEAEYRLITAAFVIEAVKIKVDAHFRSLRSTTRGYLVHYANGGRPFHCKTDYCSEHYARKAAEKLNARQGGGYTYSTVQEYIAKTRGRIVTNMMSRLPVMETTGTNYSNSVSSEAYWSN